MNKLSAREKLLENSKSDSKAILVLSDRKTEFPDERKSVKSGKLPNCHLKRTLKIKQHKYR